MKIVIDTEARTLTKAIDGSETSIGLFTKHAFEALSREWVRVGWSLKYYHNFSWFGLPILQKLGYDPQRAKTNIGLGRKVIRDLTNAAPIAAPKEMVTA